MAAAQFCHRRVEGFECGVLGCLSWATPPWGRSLSTFISKLSNLIMKQQLQHATNDTLYIGFDVHKNSVAIACARSDAEEPKFYGSCGGSNLAVERALNRVCKKFDVTGLPLNLEPVAMRVSV